jgi:hypothetical protein
MRRSHITIALPLLALCGCNRQAPPEVSWRLEPATGSPVAGLPKVNGLALADFNGDGLLDIAAVNGEPGQILILINHAERGFAPLPTGPIAVGASASGIVAGDLNDDGAPDLVICHHDSYDVAVLQSLGDGRFAPPAHHASAVRANATPHAHNLMLGDLNRDGHLDLVIAQAEENASPPLWAMARAASFPATFRSQPATTPTP